MLSSVPLPDPNGLLSFSSAKAADGDQQKGRNPCRQIIDQIIQLCRCPSEVKIGLILIAQHTVHGIHRLIKKGQKRTADQKIKEGCDHAIGEILGYRLDSCLYHPFLRQRLRISSDDTGKGLPCIFQAVCLQFLINQHAFLLQIPQSQNLPAPKHFQGKAQPEGKPASQEKKPCRQKQGKEQ